MLGIWNIWQRVTYKCFAWKRSQSWMASPHFKFISNWVGWTENKKNLRFTLKRVGFGWKRNGAVIIFDGLSLEKLSYQIHPSSWMLQRI